MHSRSLDILNGQSTNKQTSFFIFRSLNFLLLILEQLKKYVAVFAFLNTIYICRLENKYRNKNKKKRYVVYFYIFNF